MKTVTDAPARSLPMSSVFTWRGIPTEVGQKEGKGK